MKLAIGCLGLSLFAPALLVPAPAGAEAPMPSDLEPAASQAAPERAWACASSGVEAARVVRTPEFSRLRITDVEAVVLVDSPVAYVVVEGDARAVVDVEAQVSDGTLTLSRRDCTASIYGLRLVIGAPRFDDIDVSGVRRVRSDGAIEIGGDEAGAEIDLRDVGASDIEVRGGELSAFLTGGFHRLTVRVGTLIAHHSGAGVLRVSGTAKSASLGQDGPGYVIADQLETSDIVTDRAGPGEIRIAEVR